MTLGRLALWSVLSISFGLLVNEIMLSAVFHVLLGAGNTQEPLHVGELSSKILRLHQCEVELLSAPS